MLSLDVYLYELSNIFLLPIQICIVLLFIYACFSFGVFIMQFFQRKKSTRAILSMQQGEPLKSLKGFSLLAYAIKNPHPKREDLEIHAGKELEYLRIVTRIGPMLGLVGTMIPMGPALKALSNGNVQGISDSLIIAFTAVIFSLLAASITFWIASVRKQWLIEDIRFVENWFERDKAQQLNIVVGQREPSAQDRKPSAQDKKPSAQTKKTAVGKKKILADSKKELADVA